MKISKITISTRWFMKPSDEHGYLLISIPSFLPRVENQIDRWKQKKNSVFTYIFVIGVFQTFVFFEFVIFKAHRLKCFGTGSTSIYPNDRVGSSFLFNETKTFPLIELIFFPSVHPFHVNKPWHWSIGVFSLTSRLTADWKKRKISSDKFFSLLHFFSDKK